MSRRILKPFNVILILLATMILVSECWYLLMEQITHPSFKTIPTAPGNRLAAEIMDELKKHNMPLDSEDPLRQRASQELADYINLLFDIETLEKFKKIMQKRAERAFGSVVYRATIDRFYLYGQVGDFYIKETSICNNCQNEESFLQNSNDSYHTPQRDSFSNNFLRSSLSIAGQDHGELCDLLRKIVSRLSENHNYKDLRVEITDDFFVTNNIRLDIESEHSYAYLYVIEPNKKMADKFYLLNVEYVFYTTNRPSISSISYDHWLRPHPIDSALHFWCLDEIFKSK